MKKKGFTLMEIILVLGLLTTMVIGLTDCYISEKYDPD